MLLDDVARAELVREWMRSSKTQGEFCAEKGISTRVLREWVRRFGITDRPEARARAIIDTAIAQLQALKAALDTEETLPVANEQDACQEAAKDHTERHAEPEPLPNPAATGAPAPESATAPRMKKSSFFDGLVGLDASPVEPLPRPPTPVIEAPSPTVPPPSPPTPVMTGGILFCL